MFLTRIVCGLLLIVGTGAQAENATPVNIVTAQGSYAAMARTIGAGHVKVVTLARRAGADVRVLEADSRASRAIAEADIVVVNGLGLDAALALAVQKNPGARPRTVLDASVLGRHIILPDDNSYLFYSPRIMLLMASRLSDTLAERDPAHGAAYRQGLERFRSQLQPVYAQVLALISDYPDIAVLTATPLYAYMLDLLGYRDDHAITRDRHYASPLRINKAADDMRRHRIRLFLYERDARDGWTRQQIRISRKAQIPVAAIDDMLAVGESYADWQARQLRAIKTALDEHTTVGA
ncbi:metal ABC transporter solute-binding protein, Zn/Mn family [Salinisphaera aquimarina]|uniref:Metal ABC transporter solute-binding protein, Zn/Mn family n=1 Tax=Salinisphaera aquimarina TaxID=2094031 RepID=A0ABV7EKM5_9GAMM